jgi:hypothetical protein
VATRIWEGPTKEKLDDREAYGEDRGISEP